LATTVCASVLFIFAPNVVEAPSDERPPPLARALRDYLATPLYRLSLATGIAAGTVHYVIIGFLPVFFVDRGIDLTVVALLVGIGRLASALGKVVGGRMFDSLGGPRAALRIMIVIAVFGVPVVVLPEAWGLALIVPFVCVTATLFPVSNALSVEALPARSSWGIGVYRAILVTCSAVIAGIVGLLLHVFSLQVVMAGSLVVPLAASAAVMVMLRRQASAGPTTEVVPGGVAAPAVPQ
jgi:predicted MFS family arabinose efflux permease